MSGTGSSGNGSFSSLWHRSTDKLSPKKFKFMPSNVAKTGNGKEGEDAATAALSAKQHRRAQVRKAQTEHRQRKANHVKQLEQDIIDLRKMIITAETEASLVEQENEAIRKIVVQAKLPTSTSDASFPPMLPTIQNEQLDLQFQPNPHQDLTQSQFNNDLASQEAFLQDSNSSLVSIIFDELVGQECLHVSPSTSQETLPQIINSPDIFNFPNNAFAAKALTNPLSIVSEPSNTNSLPTAVPQSLPASTIAQEEELDLATIAINFILALEHPCRTHFHHHSPTTPFDPTGDPSGHELMASTLMYSSAPEPVFSDFAPGIHRWTSSKSSEDNLKQLEAMSRSLPKADWEITPVQAWFRMVEQFGVDWITAGSNAKGNEAENVLEWVKKDLAKIVGCFAFGAVMDEKKFCDVMEENFNVGGGRSLVF
ncbi:uncharacterized protein BP5553_06955 [Venustampulla echinocandica]|uniref:BZIP domain-containing protein n=1 Tax=Venustampulla echinocandica TaxID=2656787 RepID=A0A370TI41_9HELO|nr:uncharacterized protein BP5553_06955 [Venustampulla echinocandica]RDL35024.1 hypothetical protein BP5553_06955 [Venustampulla echinocandica]